MIHLSESAAVEVRKIIEQHHSGGADALGGNMSGSNVSDGDASEASGGGVATAVKSMYLRVGVTGGGCSGFQYALGFDSKADEAEDFISEQHGLTVAVKKKFALHLDGTNVDFYDGLEKRGFTFENPNAVKSCGCGQSFSA